MKTLLRPHTYSDENFPQAWHGGEGGGGGGGGGMKGGERGMEGERVRAFSKNSPQQRKARH